MLIVLLLLALLPRLALADAPGGRAAETAQIGSDRPLAFAAATGHHLAGAFLTVWRARGGLATFGYPLGEATRDASGRWVQVTERALLSLPPTAQPGRVADAGLVSLELLGRDLTAGRGDEPAFRPVAPPGAGALWFAATGHTLAGSFLSHWSAHDGLVTLGYPISEELREEGLTVQWFERGRLERHPVVGQVQRTAVGRLAPRAARAMSPPVPPLDGAVGLESLPPLPAPARLAAASGGGFGLGEQAASVLFPIGRGRSVPPDTRPHDLINGHEGSFGGGWISARSILLGDLAEMTATARERGLTLEVISGYRSVKNQAAIIDRETRLLRARGVDPSAIEREIQRTLARPGESEHHLGTVIDFNNIYDEFGETAEGRFLAEEGWRYGFLLSYPAGAEGRTGFIYEPWHLRWVGRPLAAAIQRDGYLAGGGWAVGQSTLQDYLESALLLLPASLAPPMVAADADAGTLAAVAAGAQAMVALADDTQAAAWAAADDPSVSRCGDRRRAEADGGGAPVC
jgi:hypothetical protein